MNSFISLLKVKLTTCMLLIICSVFSQTVTPWLTTGDKTKLIAQQNTVSFAASSGSANATISINTGLKYQTMDGFGFAFTEGSAEVISTLSAMQQDALLTELFNKTTGIGVSVIRISIGASDLSSSDYFYNSTPGDVNMTNFSLAGPDLTYLIPLLKKMLIINPDIKILASPWSPPLWMKSNNGVYGGSLLTKYYTAYANYFVRYFHEMKLQGINIWGITVQNEPGNGTNDPSMLMTSAEQKNFINNYLGSAMALAGFGSIKIIAYDHNCDNTAFPIDVCNNSAYVDGAAFHLYAGNISAMTTVKNATNKNIYFTEQYTGAGGDFSGGFSWHMQNVIIGAATNWAKAIIEWNLASNPTQDPHTVGGCSTCLGAITVDNALGYTRNVSYYIVGQISKFVKDGAVRIDATTSDATIGSVGFKNSDGSNAVLIYNSNNSSKTVKVLYSSKSFNYTIPAASAVTFVWKDVTTLNEELNVKKTLLYPNSSGAVLTIKNFDNVSFTYISILTMKGESVLQQKLEPSNHASTVNISTLPKGIYIAKLGGKNDVICQRFIKQ